jgi:hypothetical protein
MCRAASLLALALVVASAPAESAAGESGAVTGDDPPPTHDVPCDTERACVQRLGRGHVCEAGRCAEYVDRRDLLSMIGMGHAESPRARAFEPFLAAVPVVGYSPSSGVLLGLAGQLGIVLGDPKDTTISNATSTVLVTSKSQFIATLAATALTPRNEFELLSDFRFLVFNQDTFGLGTGTTPLATGVSVDGFGNLAALPGAQPMSFNLLRLHQSVLRRVFQSFYLGIGYRLDRYYAIVDKDLNLSATPPVVTSHYAYSVLNGFDPAAYTTSGFALEAVSDSRDSTIAPYRGHLAHVGLSHRPTWLGSTKESSRVAGEGRLYIGLSDNVPRNVLALWIYGAGPIGGVTPYLALPAIGWDATSTSGRGYVQGRFRGTSELYAEAELRFRISEDGLWGGTVFVNASTFSRPSVSLPQYGYSQSGESLFANVKPAGGVGLRIMLIKQSRTNLRIDLAGGVDSVCFYFGAGEAF